MEKGIAKRYFGGKGASGAVQKIINCIRPHDTLVEAYLGNGYLSRSIKKPSRIIGNDLNSKVYNKWIKLGYPWMELYNLPAIELLKQLNFEDLSKTVIYLDPPYPLSSRKSPKLVYDSEMTDEDHEKLLDFILHELPGNVDLLISTYPNSIYENKLRHWSKIEYQVKTSRGMATEVLYYNYSDLSLIHDYSFAGDNYRERLQIKRKAKRWANRLEKMPDYEKQAIIEEVLKLPEFSTAAVTSKMALSAGVIS
jgi:site-specific DNA-adenine methylase